MEYTLLLIVLTIYGLSLLFSLLKKASIVEACQPLGVFLHFVTLIMQFINAQHLLFANIYGFLLVLTFLLQIKFILFQRSKSDLVLTIQKTILFILVLLLALLGPESKVINPMMPTLYSFWMYIHALSYLFAYVSLFSASALALLHVFSKKSIFNYDKQLDLNVSFSYIFLLIGAFSGAIWRQLSLGNFCSLNPFEIWTLIYVLLLSLYFHKDDRKTQSWIVLVTTLTVLFSYYFLIA